MVWGVLIALSAPVISNEPGLKTISSKDNNGLGKRIVTFLVLWRILPAIIANEERLAELRGGERDEALITLLKALGLAVPEDWILP